MKKDVYGIFYNPTKLLSYGKPLLFSLGCRSIGKSTGIALKLLIDFIEKGRQFIYCRRTKDELMLTAANYFDNAVSILRANGWDIDNVVFSGGVYKMGDRICGYAIPLNLQQKYKSSNYSDVWYILYDEFMVMPGSQSRYIGGKSNISAEVEAMTSLYQTVDRGIGRAFRNETTIIFVGNAGSFYNPFFITYEIDRYLRPDTKYLSPKDSLYVVEFTRETEATKLIKESYGYLMSTEKTRSYAYDNRFADLSGDSFIEKNPPGTRTPLCNLIYEGNCYGVFAYWDAGYIYISHKRAEGRPDISLTTVDHRPNYLMMTSWKGHPVTKRIKEMYDTGNIRFYDYKCKMVIDFYLSYDA